ncbi:hypothetical protein [uncultured Campylobacter sp.]|uniref:hypothetical protein n=1 Tax=uncultured Campylobacter sp. TaxID=218934 RepID=UPI002612E7E0|nr:hypothetical protein [uncultured Campylobacter sp.]
MIIAFSNAICAPWNLKFSVQAEISSANLCEIRDAAENGKHRNSKFAALKGRPTSLPRPLTLLAADIFAPLAVAKQKRLVSKASGEN